MARCRGTSCRSMVHMQFLDNNFLCFTFFYQHSYWSVSGNIPGICLKRGNARRLNDNNDERQTSFSFVFKYLSFIMTAPSSSPKHGFATLCRLFPSTSTSNPCAHTWKTGLYTPRRYNVITLLLFPTYTPTRNLYQHEQWDLQAPALSCT